MRILGLFCPPLAVILAGGSFSQIMASFILTLCLIIPGSLYAFVTVGKIQEEKREDKEFRKLSKAAMLKAMRE